MSGIRYVRGDATVPSAKGVKLIAQVCNDLGGWGKGFVLAVSRRWPGPEAAYRAWHRDRAANGPPPATSGRCAQIGRAHV